MTEKHTPEFILRIRITSVPDPQEFDEYDVSRYQVGGTYELPYRLASLLVLAGHAESAGAVLEQAADFGRPKFSFPKNRE